jgi:HEAT repeat protein
MGQIFISYKHQERVVSFVQKLKEELEHADFDVWVDSELLRPGQDWKKEIDSAIKASIALVVIMTPDAFKSQYVTYEWAFAIGRGMEVIPLIFENTELHPRLNDIQFIDFTNHFDPPWKRLIERLVEIETGVSSKDREIPPFVKRAVDALESYELEDREEAINRLTKSNHPAAIEALANGVTHHLEDVRIYAAIKLAEVTKSQDLRCLSGLIEGRRSKYRSKVLDLLASTDTFDAIESLIEMLPIDGIEMDIKNHTSYIMDPGLHKAFMKISNPEVTPLFVKLLDGKSWRLALNVLAKLQDTRVTTRLIDILSNFDERAQSVVETMGNIGDPQAIIPLTKILQTPNLMPNQEFIGVMQYWGKFGFGQRQTSLDSDEAKAELNEHIRDWYKNISEAAAQALTRIGTPEALAAVEEWQLQQQGGQP